MGRLSDAPLSEYIDIYLIRYKLPSESVQIRREMEMTISSVIDCFVFVRKRLLIVIGC